MIQIVITDDHELVMQGIESMLQNTDVKVIGKYTHAEETLQKLATSQPNILLLDINLPDINGIDLCKQLVKLYSYFK